MPCNQIASKLEADFLFRKLRCVKFPILGELTPLCNRHDLRYSALQQGYLRALCQYFDVPHLQHLSLSALDGSAADENDRVESLPIAPNLSQRNPSFRAIEIPSFDRIRTACHFGGTLNKQATSYKLPIDSNRYSLEIGGIEILGMNSLYERN